MATTTEKKVINDNGQLKLVNLDINNGDTLATITSGSHRTVIPLRGNNPVASEEVRIGDYAPTYPGSNWYDYKASNQYVKDSEIPELQKRVRRIINLPNINYTEKRENGGKMVTDYMQDGGLTADPMEDLKALVEDAMTGNKQAQDAIKSILQKAQQGDPQAQQYALVIQEMIQSVQLMKCGGKAKAKKAQRGLPIKPCKCKLARVGGKIMEVDSCTGLPIKKEGGQILKAALGNYLRNPFSSWQEFKAQVGMPVQAIYDFVKKAAVRMQENPYNIYNSEQKPTSESLKSSTQTPKTLGDVKKQLEESRKGVQKIQSDNKQKDLETRDAYKVNNPDNLSMYSPNEQKKEDSPENKSKGYFADRGLREYQSKSARQKFVSENKDWLNELGFNAEGYDYSGALNVRLAELIKQFKNRPDQPTKQSAPETPISQMRTVDGAPEYLVNGVWMDEENLNPNSLQTWRNQNTPAPRAVESTNPSIPRATIYTAPTNSILASNRTPSQFLFNAGMQVIRDPKYRQGFTLFFGNPMEWKRGGKITQYIKD